jgi:hypothetical protein
MTGPFWSRKTLLLVGAVLACAAVAVSIGLVFPTPVESPALGAGWQCRRAAIVTTCSRVSHAAPIIHRPRLYAIDARGA